jgi:hypothetical protein
MYSKCIFVLFVIEKGCNMELARRCFSGLSNNTVVAMVTADAEKKKQACEYV